MAIDTRRKIGVVASTVLLLHCAAGGVEPWLETLDEPPAATAEERLTWPEGSSEAYVTHVGTIDGRSGFSRRPSLLRRAWSALSGSSSGRAFVRPAGICVAGSLLAVADAGASRLHLLDLETRRWHEAFETIDGRLEMPVDVACLSNGQIVVSDSLKSALYVFGREGEPLGRFADGPFLRPTGLAYDTERERLWVTETTAHRVRAFDRSGREVLRTGRHGSGVGEFNHPTRIGVDGRGGAWVTDSLNYRLQQLNADGTAIRVLGTAGDRAGSLARPRGVVADDADRVIVVDALLDAVQVFDRDGRLLLAFGGRGADPGRLWLPSGIARDEGDRLFVADSYNSRIQVYAYAPPAHD